MDFFGYFTGFQDCYFLNSLIFNTCTLSQKMKNMPVVNIIVFDNFLLVNSWLSHYVVLYLSICLFFYYCKLYFLFWVLWFIINWLPTQLIWFSLDSLAIGGPLIKLMSNTHLRLCYNKPLQILSSRVWALGSNESHWNKIRTLCPHEIEWNGLAKVSLPKAGVARQQV